MILFAYLLAAAVAATRSTTMGTRELKPDESLSAATIGDARRIVLHGGTYFITEPLVLKPAHSGLIIEAAVGATPVVSGGRRIEGWREAEFNGRKCWAADVPGVKDGKWFFRELWIDGRSANRARSPNSGVFRIKESPDAGEWQKGVSRFVFSGDDIPPGPFSYGAEAVAMNRWIENRLPLRDVNVNTKVVGFLRRSHFTLEANDPYWLEGDARFLDQPGEWFLDRAAGTIYYIPLPGEQIDKIDAIAPVLSQLLILAGDPDNKKFIDNVTIRGITFSHTQWNLPEVDPATTQPADSAGFSQAALPVPAAIRAEGTRGCTFENITITHTGTHAIDLARGCARNIISRCTLRDLGAGGIKLGPEFISQKPTDQSFANEISNCRIHDAGHVFPSAVGIWVGQSYDNRIVHNEIHDLYYSGISTGWSWGYGDSLNRGNIIEKNHIHHIGNPRNSINKVPVLSDMGGIYILGGRAGSLVKHNHIHDITAIKYGGWGIYLDEGSSNVRVDSNLVYRTTHGGFHLHYGKDNLITNNIFSDGQKWQIQFSKEEDHNGFVFTHNIVHFTEAPAFSAAVGKVKSDYNLYGPIPADKIRFGDKTFDQWQSTGQDKHSIIADPSFADPQNGDFRFKEPAMAQSIGFVPFDVADAGPIIPHPEHER